jgi:hypothetical protein
LPAKPKGELTLHIIDSSGKLVHELSSKKPATEEDEGHPDQPWYPFKPTVLPKEAGVNRVAWDLTYAGPTVIPAAKNDAGVPHRGPSVPPGVYTLKLIVDGVTLTGSVQVTLDPRVKLSDADLAEQHRFSLQVRDDITTLSKTVIALQSARKQLAALRELWKDDAKLQSLVKQGKELIERLDALEAKLHNPKAEVSYDILAMKGGAKLYSQQSFLYSTVMDGDGPVTQGMREVHDDQRRELERLMTEWRGAVAEIERFNASARTAAAPAVTVK